MKRKFARTCLAFAIALKTSFVMASSYEKIAEDTVSTLYLVRGSVDRSGRKGSEFPSLKVMLDFSSGLQLQQGFSRSATVHMFLDCQLRRQIITATEYHAGPMGRGRVLVTDHEPSNNTIQGSFEIIFRRLCK